ncbi:MAG: hypothetical protein A3J75_07980 [Acidobacteria bacterium RBG_16_68_9]|nr:MAG: hypothetical protein A3J75_07980 [Acidobacteria bacterium RBG_16_68_9]
MLRFAMYIVLGSLVMVLNACATQTSKSTEVDAVPVASAAPPGSPLSQIAIGMNKKQVRDILGSPTDENSYSTGKAWIPFYFGTDARRTSWFYKGLGAVVFADGNVFGGGAPEVVRIDYNPTESGAAR